MEFLSGESSKDIFLLFFGVANNEWMYRWMNKYMDAWKNIWMIE